MAGARRIFLVVEDDELINYLHARFCKEALQEVAREGLSVEGEVERASGYTAAQQILENKEVDIVLLDLALGREEEGWDEQKRRQAGDVGGMKLLRQLQQGEKRPIVVVISAETLPAYAIEAYQTYGVWAVYHKSDDYQNRLRAVIKSALYYLNASDYIKEPEAEQKIETVRQNWQRALELAKAADIDVQNLFKPPIPHVGLGLYAVDLSYK